MYTHTQNGILASKMEENWVICRHVDGSRACHRVKSERICFDHCVGIYVSVTCPMVSYLSC